MKIIASVIFILFALMPVGRGEVEFDIPDEHWERIYFKSINKLTNSAGLVPLREKSIDEEKVELRIWIGFGLSSLEGLIFEKSNGVFRATHIRQSYNPTKKNVEIAKNPLDPKVPLETLWEWVESEGLFQLPDDSSLESDGIRVVDGVSYAVEYRDESIYRTFKYGNPVCHKWPEAQQISKIMMVLERELGIELYQPLTTYIKTVRDGQVVLVKKGNSVGAFQFFEQRGSSLNHPEDTAVFKWAYGHVENDTFELENCVQGQTNVSGWAEIKFGNFSLLKWSVQTSGEGRIYYSDPHGKLVGNPDREFAVITDEFSIDGIKWSDPKYEFKATNIEFPELPWD